ncbi:hypothetical protein BB561_000577 [Smittium simulii]|uniref:30S ribosomal protein S8 n=1 Tax=Smittium simulii TaxID=133385 RepID=A0A2T9YYG1_9FUNG|nr:hypothetical protein BB561_000577 [Smittium simulii]
MVGVYDICSRVHNGFRARLSKIAVPETKLNLAVSRVLYQSGFLYSITRGTNEGPDLQYTPTTNLNIARRRLWLSLKYFNDKPVLNQMKCISKPSLTVKVDYKTAKRLVSGHIAKMIKPITPGEVIIVSTQEGIMDLQKATDKNLGGILLARVS